jgi:hypothetical protein
MPYAVWDGGSLAGKTILIVGEPELVDDVMFASCYPNVIERAARCVIACDPRLERLLRRSFPRAQLVAAARGRHPQSRMPDRLRIDVQISAGSLPRILRPAAESFPKRASYLVADPAAVEVCGRDFAKLGPALKIGVATSSASGGISRVSELQGGLADIRDATLIALPPESNSLDIDDLAARVAAIDVLISDGGLAAHLAGAMGVPCWILLADDADWRWLGQDERTLWYPMVRLFRASRNCRNEERRTPVERLLAELLNWIAQNADNSRMRSVRAPHFCPSPLAQTLPPISGPPLIS